MPLRPLTSIERQRVKRLTTESIDFSLIQPTRTGLEKSILDATIPVRNYLQRCGIHDYASQGRGAPMHGVKFDAALLSSRKQFRSRASLYRPKTKKGDPRIWFTGLPRYAQPDDILAIIGHDHKLYVINITREDIEDALDSGINGPLHDTLSSIRELSTAVSQELLNKLRDIASSGLVPSVMPEKHDTAIGRTLEACLGIEMNSSREPDYKGIELKAKRLTDISSQATKQTLFAKVPNWSISKFKSSRQILEVFGYTKENILRLYCTVNTLAPNSQGLSLKIGRSGSILNEVSDQRKYGAFASWYLNDLRTALAKKHKETFWVSAFSHLLQGHEHFEFSRVLHTKGPILSQFDILLEQGEISMDHLIKRDSRGGVRERGPLFRINPHSIQQLFPRSQTYDLVRRQR